MMLAASLKTLRHRAGLTQSDLASALGVATATVAMWETGKREPDYEKLLKISELFSVSADYLLGNDGPLLDERLSGIEFALFGEVKDLTDEQKQDILDYVRYKKKQRDDKKTEV